MGVVADPGEYTEGKRQDGGAERSEKNQTLQEWWIDQSVLWGIVKEKLETLKKCGKKNSRLEGKMDRIVGDLG